MNPSLESATGKELVDQINDRIWHLRVAPHAGYNPAEELEKALATAKELSYDYGIARSTLNLGMGEFILRNNTAEAFRLLNEALLMFKDLSDERWIANTFLTMAILSTSSGKPEEALYYMLRGIDFYEKGKGPVDADNVMAFYIAGTVYKDLRKYREAEEYYNKAILQENGNTAWFGRVYASLANIANERGEYAKALGLAQKSYAIIKQEGNEVGLSRALTDIGNIHRNLGDLEKALEYFEEAAAIRERLGLKQFLLGSVLDIAALHRDTGNPGKAVLYFEKAEQLAKETAHENRLSLIYRELATLHKAAGDLPKAVLCFEHYISLSESLRSREKEQTVESVQNSLLHEKEKEIERLRNVELKQAYDLISEKNKEITDSIHYAQRIQKAVLPGTEELQNLPVRHFVLFRPKDIVSGDFYWTAQKNGTRFLAVCDSTGHGVPGAFMSLLNISYLSEAVTEKQITRPDAILNHVREKLIAAISQDGAKDGMDCILLAFARHNEKLRVSYAAANNAPVLVRERQAQFLKADKMPVGKGFNESSFSLFEFVPEEKDRLFLFTDGFADQFGGPKGKKFRYKQLEELLVSTSALPLEEQCEQISRAFDEWKGSLEQVDDMLMIGLAF